MSTTVTEQELANHEHVGSGEVAQENAPAPATETAPAPAPAKKKSTAQNLIGTRYEEFVTDGRFRPGYDAKAKSAMINDAISDNPELVAEAERVLGIMNWTHFLTTKREALTAAANKPKTPAGERPLTGAAKAAKERAAAKAAGNGTAVSEEASKPVQSAPQGNTIWIRQARRGFFVMRGEEPIQRFDPEQQEQAVALAQSTYDTAIANGETLELNLTPQA